MTILLFAMSPAVFIPDGFTLDGTTLVTRQWRSAAMPAPVIVEGDAVKHPLT